MREALKALLDAHMMSRKVMFHLGLFERALGLQGLKVLSEMPVETLSAAVDELELIVSDWSNRPLSKLRARMVTAVVDRLCGPVGDVLTDPDNDGQTLVSDVSHSLFMEIDRQYQTTSPVRATES